MPHRATFSPALALAAAAVLPLMLTAVHAAPPPLDELAAAVDRLFAEWDTTRTPGAAVLITDGPDVVLERCYGMADLEHGLPITPETRFDLASVSKPFTAYAVLLLAREDRLDLDDDVRLHLPELPDHGTTITIRNLLHHTSGLSEWRQILAYAGVRSGDTVSLEDLLAMLEHQRVLDFPPGSRWQYSNTNYALLAEIVARVTGRPFGEWMAENVFLPLEMNSTSIPADGTRILPDRANSYRRRSGELVRSLVERFEIPGPAHTFSTLRDMARWTDNFRTGKLGGPELVREMKRKGRLNNGEEIFYAAGVGIGEHRGLRTVGHSGQTGGFKSQFLYCPEVEVGVVVLANERSLNAERLARSVLDLYLGDRLEPLPEVAEEEGEDEGQPFIEPDPAALARFAGGYRLEADPSVLLAVARDGDSLAGILVGEGMDFFHPVAEAEFENRSRNCRLTFIPGKDGRVERLRVVLKGRKLWAAPVALDEDPAVTDGFSGAYYSEELGTVYEIARDGERFVVRQRRLGEHSLQQVERDRLAGGIGLLTFARGERGQVLGFELEEPEELGQRKLAFRKIEPLSD
jgi:CubicO group peptidase (beta-lactamase class C family)